MVVCDVWGRVVGGVALIKITGGSDLLLVVAPGDAFSSFPCTFQPRPEPPIFAVSFDFGTAVGLHFGAFWITLVHLSRS